MGIDPMVVLKATGDDLDLYRYLTTAAQKMMGG